MSNPCPFCAKHEVLARNEHAFLIYDRWPASRGHSLVVATRHVEDFFKTSREERQAMLALLDDAKLLLDATYAPHGYTVGVNVGETAGPTVMHCHIHIIPRYRGDSPNPRGGIRAVIPGKQSH